MLIPGKNEIPEDDSKPKNADPLGSSAATGYVAMPVALTAENGAKSLLMGEFCEYVEMPNEEYCGCGECDYCHKFPHTPETIKQAVPVSWTTIKEIYAMAVKHLAT